MTESNLDCCVDGRHLDVVSTLLNHAAKAGLSISSGTDCGIDLHCTTYSKTFSFSNAVDAINFLEGFMAADGIDYVPYPMSGVIDIPWNTEDWRIAEGDKS